MRKALELKDDELKAFCIKASVGQRRQGAYCTKGPATGRRAYSTPHPPKLGPGSCLLHYSGHEHRWWDVDTGTRLRGQLAPGEGLNLPAATPWPFPVLAS